MSLLEGFETMRLIKVGPSLKERLERWVAEQHHKAVIDRLRSLREGVERECALIGGRWCSDVRMSALEHEYSGP